jgi:cytochrome oxidase Cu insertion factor (SCO1/SenC/PrrC family)
MLLGAGCAVLLAVGLARAQSQQEMIRRLESALLPVGQKAPSFELPAVGGGKLSLAEINRGKSVLVNFWFYG